MLAPIVAVAFAASPVVQVDHGSSVIAVALSPDDKVLATAGQGAALKLWSLDGKLLHTLSLGKTDVLQLAFSADGKWLAGGDLMGAVSVWSVADGKTVAAFKVADTSDRLLFSPDRKLLAVGVMLGPGVLVSTSDWKQTATFDGSPVVWTPDSEYVLAAARAGLVWVDTAGKQQKVVETPGRHRIVVAADHKQALSRDGMHPEVQIWDLKSGKLVGALAASTSGVVTLSLTRDGKRALTGAEEGVTRLWDIASMKELAKWDGKFAALSASGKHAAASAGNIVHIWPAPAK